MQALAGAALYFAWMVPNHYPPWTSFYNESMSAIGLLLLASDTFLRRCAAEAPVAAWVAVLVAVIPCFQWAVGHLASSGDAWVSCLYLLGLATAICVGFNLSKIGAARFASWLAVVTLAAALSSSAVAAAQCLDVSGGIWLAEIPLGSRGIGNLAQPNNLATLIALGAVGLWLLYEQRRLDTAPALGALSVLLMGTTLTQSRTALIFGPALLLLRAATRQNTGTWRLTNATLLGAVVLQWLLALAWPPVRHFIGLDAPDSLSQLSLESGRSLVWPVLIDGALQRPWFGHGWLQTGSAQLSVAEHHPQVDELFLQSHNLVLDLVIWCGLPLGFLLSALLAVWFVRRIQEVSSREAIFGLMCVALFGVHSLLEFPHQYAYFLIPIGLWIGVIEAESKARSVGPAWVTRMLAVGTAALAVAVSWDYPVVEEDFRLMRFETLSIGRLHAAQPAPDAPLLSSLTEYLRFMRTPIIKGLKSDDLLRMETVVKRYPYTLMIYRYAKALALNEQLPAALLMMDKLRHMSGEPRYQALRGVVHQEVLDGATGLAALEAALPP